MGLRGEQRSGGRDRRIDRERDLEIEETEVMKERRRVTVTHRQQARTRT